MNPTSIRGTSVCFYFPPCVSKIQILGYLFIEKKGKFNFLVSAIPSQVIASQVFL